MGKLKRKNRRRIVFIAVFSVLAALRFAALIYLALPLNFFHGRLVMFEPLMAVFFMAALYFYRLSEL